MGGTWWKAWLYAARRWPCCRDHAVESMLSVGTSVAWLIYDSIRVADSAAAHVCVVFGRAEYLNALPDAVAQFSTPIMEHMNKDHSETTKAMIEHYVTGGIEVRSRTKGKTAAAMKSRSMMCSLSSSGMLPLSFRRIMQIKRDRRRAEKQAPRPSREGSCFVARCKFETCIRWK